MTARILIVEDNADNLKLMTYLLRAFGHETLAAHTGEEALALLGREQPDLVVCDIQLPGMDGCEVARRLKADAQLCRIPLVAVTALAMVGDRDRMLAAGFDGYLSKPITPQTFVRQVEAHLGAAARSEPRPPAPTAAPAPKPQARGVTVLVVDNTPVNLELARKTLEPFGYRLVTAGRVSEALELARREPPDLILSDLHMPRQDGFDFIRAVKADERLRSIPFLFISSTVWQDTDCELGLSLGADGFLLRPLAPRDLLAKIEACLNGRRGSDERPKPSGCEQSGSPLRE
jgi:two-component system cell cycle response regulator